MWPHPTTSRAPHTRQDLPVVATVAVTVAGLAELHERHRDAAATLGAAARLRGAHDPTDPHIHTLSTRTRTALGDKDLARGTQRAGNWMYRPP